MAVLGQPPQKKEDEDTWGYEAALPFWFAAIRHTLLSILFERRGRGAGRQLQYWV